MGFRYIAFMAFISLNTHSSGYYLNSSKVNLELYNSVRVFSGNNKIKNESFSVIDHFLNDSSFDLTLKNFDASPASKVCEKYNGLVSIIHDEKYNEISICLFEDKSFFLTWDLIKIKMKNEND